MQPKQKRKKLWTEYGIYAIIIVGLYFAFLNISPYEKVIGFMSASVRDSLIVQLLSSIPFVGWVVQGLGKTLIWGLAAIIWAIIQIIEILPLVIFSDDRLLLTIIQEGDRKAYQINESDDPALKSVKRIYNRLPLVVVRHLKFAQIFTYTVDFLLLLLIYPPVTGNTSDFLFTLAVGDWQSVNWFNIWMGFVTLFACEIVVVLLIYAIRLNEMYKLSRGV